MTVASAPTPAPSSSERTIVALVGAVQFVNILDFMMVMPLGPDFAAGLGIPVSSLGIIGGSYTAAAAVSGLLGAFVLDRFDRRKALVVCMAGLVVGTAAGALATGLGSLVAARVIAGIFGGPASAVALSIIADIIPIERRGRAMSAVMGAFSAASVLGVPAGLELARLGGWRAPFLGVAALGAVISVLAFAMMPPLRGHLDEQRAKVTMSALAHMALRPVALMAFVLLGASMMAAFSIIPNISPHLIQNLHFPRAELGMLYLVGGAVSFFSMRVAGIAVDRIGSARITAAGTVAFACVVWLAFGMTVPPLPLTVLFAGLMVAQTTRNVATNTLMSRVPAAHERAGFMSLQSMVQHLASATGAVASSAILSEGPGGALVGVPTLALCAIAISLVSLPLAFAIERRVRGAADALHPTH